MSPTEAAHPTFAWLDSLPVARLRLRFRMLETRTLWEFTENRVRSSLGNFLRMLEPCAEQARPECRPCPHRLTCDWHRNFAGEHEGWPTHRLRPFTFALHMPTPPGPEGEYLLKAGDCVTLELTLFGAQAEHPHKLLAALLIPQAGEALWVGPAACIGVEKLMPSGESVPYRLDELPSVAHPWREWLETSRAQTLAGASRWRLTLLSPLQAVVNKGEIERTGDALELHHLARLALRRIFQLVEDSGGSTGISGPEGQTLSRLPAPLQAPVFELAEQVKVVDRSLRWVERFRRGTRTYKTTDMSGLVGSLTVEGPIPPLLPLLLAAELSHLGKHAAFGLGKVRLEAM